MIKQIRNSKFVIRNYQAGMTYVELIVVLSIFSVMTSIVLFNYNGFQSKIDIRVLANDIALKIVEAQKAAVSGKLPPLALQSYINKVTWKPSYGVSFYPDSPEHFFYFTDLNNSNFFNGLNCNGECLNNIVITKGNTFKIYNCVTEACLDSDSILISTPLSITFKRPNSGAVFSFADSTSVTTGFNHFKITISSADTPPITSDILVYPSGRIQINDN
ncbi:hypothetical protein COX93_02865 [Candidatus Nomurabacteria bacterium CG_4_10_14_0_2_um_filter_30_12]|uniref:General secretion pathway GspH domain-containing protein n=2 Tax=Candidatus Nomuraibacteriota TaxID=1752729 RepID=A0A2J0MF50_9BACT|nr:MAG: hypothetical protein COU48_02470 [Candidatus Nomurabacteria bacterium CG10_big_fil_rev_8_21_14_0_10_03_31_7]PIZ86894.1 MAG: hypothetical protein COX93_02865 [Candidatus Nomurabacteria bacterium CG_4_10_14_0_2_um_filter_30_12]